MGLRCVQNVQYVLKFCMFLVCLHVNKVNTACTELRMHAVGRCSEKQLKIKRILPFCCKTTASLCLINPVDKSATSQISTLISARIRLGSSD